MAVLPILGIVSSYGAGTCVEKVRPAEGVETFGGLSVLAVLLEIDGGVAKGAVSVVSLDAALCLAMRIIVGMEPSGCIHGNCVASASVSYS